MNSYLDRAERIPGPGWCGRSRSRGWWSRPWCWPAPWEGCASRTEPPPGWCSRPGAPPCPSGRRCRRRWSWRGWRRLRGPGWSSSRHVPGRTCLGSRGSRSLPRERNSSRHRLQLGLKGEAQKEEKTVRRAFCRTKEITFQKVLCRGNSEMNWSLIPQSLFRQKLLWTLNWWI